MEETDAVPLPLPCGQVCFALPDQFQGSWFGDVTRPDSTNSPYPIRLVIVSGRIGDRIANPYYPSLDRQTAWTLLAAWENELQVDERVVLSSWRAVRISVMMQPGGHVLHVLAPRTVAILNRED